MRINKLIIIPLVIVLIILFIVSKTKTGSPTSLPPPTTVIPPPISPIQTYVPSGVVFNLAPTLTLPKQSSIDAHAAVLVRSKDVIDKMLQHYTFSVTNSEIINKTVKNFIWSAQGFSLVLSESGGGSSVALSDLTTTGSGLRIDDLLSFFTAVTPDIAVVKQTQQPVSGITNFPYKESFGKPTKTTYSYAYKSVPILLNGLSNAAITIFSDAGGRIRYMTMALPVTNIKDAAGVSLLSVRDIESNLNGGRGLFMGYLNDHDWETDNPVRFTNVQISSCSLAYLYDYSSGSLLPVYLLDGVGSLGTSNARVRYLLMINTN